MKKIARFMKVSFEQYKESRGSDIDEETLKKEYDQIRLPQRATSASAGYDFVVPFDVEIGTEPILIPTGIRVPMWGCYFLMLVPRSGLGFKYGMRLKNTCGIIDADYVLASNEGHIMCKVISDTPFSLKAGDRFVQGIFIPYGISHNGNVTDARTGGMGSTGLR